MDNSTVKETWIDKLVDELVDTIDSDTALIYLLKIEYPDEYREKIKELKEIKLRKTRQRLRRRQPRRRLKYE